MLSRDLPWVGNCAEARPQPCPLPSASEPLLLVCERPCLWRRLIPSASLVASFRSLPIPS